MPDNEENKYAPAAWTAPTKMDFEVPSGGVVQVRRIDILDLLGDGLLNKLDFMTEVVQNKLVPGTKPKVPQADDLADKLTKSLLTDSTEKDEFKKVVDSVIFRVVIQPKLWPVPEVESDRVDGRIYIDSVPFTDKVAIFNWAVTGKNQADLAQFRDEAGESLGDVESSEVVPVETVELPATDRSD